MIPSRCPLSGRTFSIPLSLRSSPLPLPLQDVEEMERILKELKDKNRQLILEKTELQRVSMRLLRDLPQHQPNRSPSSDGRYRTPPDSRYRSPDPRKGCRCGREVPLLLIKTGRETCTQTEYYGREEYGSHHLPSPGAPEDPTVSVGGDAVAAEGGTVAVRREEGVKWRVVAWTGVIVGGLALYGHAVMGEKREMGENEWCKWYN